MNLSNLGDACCEDVRTVATCAHHCAMVLPCQQWISRVAFFFALESRALPLQRATDYAMQHLRDNRIGRPGVQEMEARKQ